MSLHECNFLFSCFCLFVVVVFWGGIFPDKKKAPGHLPGGSHLSSSGMDMEVDGT